ncbi:MAG TPA: M14 family metallopeptidase [Bryobacteraceae bacterium]|nr:M14 family metallopeptidase [Bryobacteraceae bacterium]
MRRIFLPFAGAVLISLVFPAARAADLTVGTATARSGQKATGYLQVPAGVDAASSVPVIVINGAKPGPTLALVAGSHGTEYASILALEKVAQSVDPSELSGALLIVPLVNPASFAQKVPHLNPVDGKNMNRFFPGKADGTQTERVSWAIAQQVIEKCDYLIDLHGGDLDENLHAYSYWANTGKESFDATSRTLVLAFGLDHIIIQDYRPNGPNPLGTSGPTSLSRYAERLGKPAVVAEAGHAGTTHAEDVDALVRGALSVMRHLKMLAGAPAPVEHPLWIARIHVLASEHDGIFYPLTVPEAFVHQGMRIGYVTDYFGNKVWDAIAPVSGVIVYIGAVPSMVKGNTVAYIGELQ